MHEWLSDSVTFESNLTLQEVLVRLGVAVVFGGCVALTYRVSHGRHKEDASILTATLVLLSVLIAMVSIVIGDSVARAFSLVGALSIVRFRTVVEDTRDTAFVIFAVIVGMGAGAGMFLAPLAGIPLVALVAIGMSRMPSTPLQQVEAKLVIRLGLGHDPRQRLEPVFARYLISTRITGTSTARQGTALELTYIVRLREENDLPDLVSELNRQEGVQSVEAQI